MPNHGLLFKLILKHSFPSYLSAFEEVCLYAFSSYLSHLMYMNSLYIPGIIPGIKKYCKICLSEWILLYVAFCTIMEISRHISEVVVKQQSPSRSARRYWWTMVTGLIKPSTHNLLVISLYKTPCGIPEQHVTSFFYLTCLVCPYRLPGYFLPGLTPSW